eukprot:1518728-Rhodomonas_salina.2
MEEVEVPCPPTRTSSSTMPSDSYKPAVLSHAIFYALSLPCLRLRKALNEGINPTTKCTVRKQIGLLKPQSRQLLAQMTSPASKFTDLERTELHVVEVTCIEPLRLQPQPRSACFGRAIKDDVPGIRAHAHTSLAHDVRDRNTHPALPSCILIGVSDVSDVSRTELARLPFGTGTKLPELPAAALVDGRAGHVSERLPLPPRLARLSGWPAAEHTALDVRPEHTALDVRPEHTALDVRLPVQVRSTCKEA